MNDSDYIKNRKSIIIGNIGLISLLPIDIIIKLVFLIDIAGIKLFKQCCKSSYNLINDPFFIHYLITSRDSDGKYYYEDYASKIFIKNKNDTKTRVKSKNSSIFEDMRTKIFDDYIIIHSVYSFSLDIKKYKIDEVFCLNLVNNDGRLFCTFGHDIMLPKPSFEFNSIICSKSNFILLPKLSEKYNDINNKNIEIQVNVFCTIEDNQGLDEYFKIQANICRVVMIKRNQSYIWFK
jgi:hypothetical protein